MTISITFFYRLSLCFDYDLNDNKNTTKVINIIALAINIIAIFMNFHTAYNLNGAIIKTKKGIFYNYCKSFLLFDCLCMISLIYYSFNYE